MSMTGLLYMGRLPPIPLINPHMSTQFHIPAKLNVFIIIVCTLAFFGLFIAGAHTHQLWHKLFLALAFGIVMIPVYSLMHEAAHNTLHPNPSVNVFCGRWLCSMFVISFTFYRHCHLKHHKKNRTDEEMWDLYYEHQKKWMRYGNLYLMMIGLGYLSIWLSVLLFAILPKIITAPFFKQHTEVKGFLNGFTSKEKLKTAQWESLVAIIFQIGVLWLIDWDFLLWLMFYFTHGFIWSSQNYVNHAFSPREIINGAHNLKIPVWLNVVYLNFNIHLAHHQNPGIPWLYLPKFIKSGSSRFSFFRNYIRLWKGPVLTKEKPPNEDKIANADYDG
jgi:fatty acid desaturase